MRQHSRPAALILSLACLALGPAVLADDIVHFQNGTFMKVQGYTLEGDSIKVNLGPGASMSFPRALVESIERAGQTVYPQGGSRPANVVAAGSGGGTASSSSSAGVEPQFSIHHRAAAEGGSGEGDAADKDAASRSSDPSLVQFPGNRQIRAVGRRSGPFGEALVSKDPEAPAPNITKPRAFASLLPKGKPDPPSPSADPPPADPEPPQEEPPPEDDGGN